MPHPDSSEERMLQWVRFGISNLLRLTIIIAAVRLFIDGQWFTGFLALASLALLFLPSLIERNYKLTFTLEIELFILLFLYASVFLGEFQQFYYKYFWWDGMLHTLSGFILGILAFVFVYVLDHEGKVKFHKSAILMALFSFCFAVSIGALWEIFEFAVDYFLGTNLQETGLVDTMWDLILESCSAAIVAIIGYLYLKGNKYQWLNWFILRFVRHNPALFVKRRIGKVISTTQQKSKTRRKKRK